MTAELRRQAADSAGYRVVESAMSPIGGVFDAINRITGADDAVIERLRAHPTGYV